MVIAWFSCGATSAVACKIALKIYDDVHVVYIETGSGHPDNERFIKDCERWFGQPIEVIRSDKFKDVEDVLRSRKFIVGPIGASCTFYLKKQVRYKYEDSIGEWDGQVFGFDYCKREVNRAIRFRQQNKKTKPLFPLIERMITKQDAMGILQRANIEIPKMYQMGYNNNNCIGCVKGGIGYWNKIRRDFPKVYQRMAETERAIGHSCLRDKNGLIWLDELDLNRGDVVKPIIPDCSLFCDIEFANIEDPQTCKVINGEISINETY